MQLNTVKNSDRCLAAFKYYNKKFNKKHLKKIEDLAETIRVSLLDLDNFIEYKI